MVDLLAQWDWWSLADLLQTWRWLPPFSKGIALVLLTMLGHTVVTSAIAAAKQLLARKQSRRFVSETNEVLRSGRLNDVFATAVKFNRSHVAAVVAAGLLAFRELPKWLYDEDARECVERAMNRVLAIRTAEIRLGLSTLKTIAATAPLIGILGTLLGILNSFRGGGGSYSSALMAIAGGISVALMFVTLGLFVALPAMWAHDCLAKISNALARHVNNTAFNLIECVWKHPEWRDSRASDAKLEPLHKGDSRKHRWEVPYDRYTLLPLAFLLELFVYVIIGIVSTSASIDTGYALAVGVCLLAVGIVALPISAARHEGTSAAPQDASVAERFYHQSVDRRRRARLPLRQRLAVLPDRSLVFGMPLLTCLMFMLFINQSHRMPKGIDVAIAPRETAPLSKMSDRAIFVQVQKAHKTGPYMQPPLLRVQRKLVTESDLRQHLQQELARHDDRSVFIYGDKELPYQSVVNVVDLVNQLGGRPVLVGSTASSRIP